MMPHGGPETWRADLEQSGLPSDVPLAFDSGRWTRDTVLRAGAALRHARRPRRWRYGVLATAAAAAVVALSIVGHPATRRPPGVAALPIWSGRGPLSQLDMVTPTVGWAMRWQSQGWSVMYTSTGLGGFHPLVRVRPSTGAMTWTPVGTTSLVVTVGMPGTGVVHVQRISGSGRPVIRTDVVPPGAGGQSLEGWTSWSSPQQSLLYVVTNAPHGGRPWVYRTQSGAGDGRPCPWPSASCPTQGSWHPWVGRCSWNPRPDVSLTQRWPGIFARGGNTTPGMDGRVVAVDGVAAGDGARGRTAGSSPRECLHLHLQRCGRLLAL